MRWTNDSESSNECWLVIGRGTTLSAGKELTHSPFTFSLHSRAERKPLIHSHTPHRHTSVKVELKRKKQIQINTKEAVKYITARVQVNLLNVNSLYTKCI